MPWIPGNQACDPHRRHGWSDSHGRQQGCIAILNPMHIMAGHCPSKGAEAHAASAHGRTDVRSAHSSPAGLPRYCCAMCCARAECNSKGEFICVAKQEARYGKHPCAEHTHVAHGRRACTLRWQEDLVCVVSNEDPQAKPETLDACHEIGAMPPAWNARGEVRMPGVHCCVRTGCSAGVEGTAYSTGHSTG